MSDVIVHQIPAAQVSREVAEQEFAKLMGMNDYKPSDAYSGTHKNALSDGDEKGKGETSTIGNKTDIAERTKLAAMNLFSSKKPYTNPG